MTSSIVPTVRRETSVSALAAPRTAARQGVSCLARVMGRQQVAVLKTRWVMTSELIFSKHRYQMLRA
jgi:hypothetical protein